jgi:iron complex outermembrane receptor protein
MRVVRWLMIVCFLLYYLCLPSYVYTQEDDESLLFMGEGTVSTPSRRPQPIDESPASITVITTEDIRRSGALTLPEVLAILPGVEALRLSEASIEISIRGFNSYSSDKVLVMLDSRPLFNLADASVDWNLIPVSLEDIDRIELVRGPGSALYGENAFFGIINIITKTPDKDEVTFSVGGGDDPSYIARVGWESPVIRASMETLELDRFSTTRTDLTNTYLEQPGVDLIFAKSIINRAFFRSDLEEDGRRWILSGGAARLENDFFVHKNIDRSAFGSIELFFTEARVDFNSVLRASYQDQEREGSEFFPDKPFRDFLRVDYELQGVYTPFINDIFVFGFQSSYRSIHDDVYLGPDDNKLSQTISSAYFENQLAFYEKTIYLTAGLRLDSYPEIGEIISPRVGSIFLLSKSQAIKIGWGQAFRSPTLYDLHGLDATVAPFIFEGNDDLTPESISSCNLDYLFQKPGSVSFSVNLFHNEIKNLIVFKQVSVTPLQRVFQLENEDKGYSYGGEVSGRVRLGNDLEIWGNYSYDKAIYVQDDVEIDAPFSPRDKAHLGFTIEDGSWTASIWSSHIGDYIATSQDTPFQHRIDMKGYSTVSARIEYWFSRELSMNLIISDILGEGHYESPIFAPVMPYYFIRINYREKR